MSHLIQAAIDWSLLFGGSCGPLGAPCPCNTSGFLGFGAQLACPGSTFTPVAAAYQTQGMWVQADLIHQIRFTGLGSLAALMYLCSAIGGLIGVALGAPPKMYLWFFMGPPMFHFLVGTPYPVKGTEWRVGNQAQDQREVWRMAEVGLLNSNWTSQRASVYADGAPGGTVNVSWFFVQYDKLISSVIQNLTAWTGLYNMRGSTQNLRSSVGPAPADFKQIPTLQSGNWIGDRWWLLTNSKWSMVEDITNSKLANPKIRDALTTFMQSECGDSLMKNMNSSAFLSALYYKGRQSPGSVFRAEDGTVANSSGGYATLFRDMYGQRVPMPRSIRDLLKDHPTDKSSFVHSIGLSAGDGNAMRERMINMQWLRCPAYLHILLEAFRWEAGQIYHQFRLSAPAGVDEEWLMYSLLYGWNVRKPVTGQPMERWPHIADTERAEFLKNLILVHLFRNEMMILPTTFTNRKLSTRTTEESGEGHLRFIATKNKFSELYQWALMMPHMQGVLLYYLAIAFPFCAMMMVVPGYHKVTLTWMSFWLWAKMWDLGFAMVTALERSVWAMIGNNSAIQGNLPKIAELADWGRIGVNACSGPACDVACGAADKACLFSQVTLTSGGATTDLLSYTSWTAAMRIFDRALTIAANLDLDLANSYYIYIMAGLYFAVPVVVGQIVLGAKSGSASLINNVVGAVGQEAGRQGSAGHQSDMVYRMKAAKASVGQEAYAKQMRASGLAGQAIGYGNEQLMAGMNRAGLEAAAGGAAAIAQAAQLTRSNVDAVTGAGVGFANAMLNTAGGISKGIGDSNATAAAARRAQQKQTADDKNADRIVDALNGNPPLPPAGSVPPGGSGTPPKPGTANLNPTGRAIPAVQGGQQNQGQQNQGQQNQGQSPQNSGDNAGQALAIVSGAAPGAANVTKGTNPVMAALGSGYAQIGLKAASDLASATRAVGMLPYQQFGSNGEMGRQLLGSQSAIGGFGYGQQGQLFGSAEGRVAQQAEFDARSAAWEAENAYCNQFAALSTALGSFAGGFEPGSKPQDRMGMAMSGNFGADTQSAARASVPGSWMWGRAASMQSSLDSQYGPQRARDAYYMPELSDMYGVSASVVGTGAKNASYFWAGNDSGIKPGSAAAKIEEGGKNPVPFIR